ncbi:MAG: polynucleotide kinase-phosphatase [Hyphomicrobiaceae bacterium]|nr:polynucleotide kinase-phosphatase [Hyphomicrobiaceae bacterium]
MTGEIDPAPEEPIPEPPAPEPGQGKRRRAPRRAGKLQTRIALPDFCLVVLIGASGSGKSTFAKRHFKPTEIVSSDDCRGMVDDDATSLEATSDAFDLVQTIASVRLKRRRLTVIDATNVRKEDRARLVTIAKRHHALAVAIVVNPGEEVCHARNATRPDRQFGPHVVRNHHSALRRGGNALDREGFRYVYEYRSVEEIDAVEIERIPLWTDARRAMGPFDLIGDVHGCADELQALLAKLGYTVAWGEADGLRSVAVTPPVGRRALFLGDLVDRGPNTPDVLRIVMSMVASGSALAVPGNHDVKFERWLAGRKVQLTHGLAATVEQMGREPPAFHAEVRKFLDGLVSHLWLDGGGLVACHAGIRADMIGRSSGAVREFCLYGETTGEIDEYGLQVRANWAAAYTGPTTIVYGHTPVVEAELLNNTICLDTGCCFGGKLTAMRWPERELVDVPALATYAEPTRPLQPPRNAGGLTLQQQDDDLLDLALVTGKRIIKLATGRTVTIDEGQSAAALEVMARYAINPKWLIHLPPTMSPPATTARDGLLEHPDEAFAYYRSEGITDCVVQEKHMGSRALLIVCRDGDVARSRFGVATGETGAIYTRTGRAFFNTIETCEALLDRVRRALERADTWDRLNTNWVLLDAEIMPWSAKAQGLIKDQYAATWAAADAGLRAATTALNAAAARDPALATLRDATAARFARATAYGNAYRRYCWPVASVADYRVAPFHLLASEGAVHMDKDHLWHMAEAHRLADASAADPSTDAARSTAHGVMVATGYREVRLDNPASVTEATRWWEELVTGGGEGMVVKPRDFIALNARGLIQPAVKCRGPEYLRIIYGPEYDTPGYLARLRARGLARKRGLAVREFALGQESLIRFVAREPLRRIHEAVFGVLALESDPVDPRL